MRPSSESLSMLNASAQKNCRVHEKFGDFLEQIYSNQMLLYGKHKNLQIPAILFFLNTIETFMYGCK